VGSRRLAWSSQSSSGSASNGVVSSGVVSLDSPLDLHPTRDNQAMSASLRMQMCGQMCGGCGRVAVAGVGGAADAVRAEEFDSDRWVV
jgi:hypothetical protein